MFEFKNFDYLTDGEIDLKIEEKAPANEEITHCNSNGLFLL